MPDLVQISEHLYRYEDTCNVYVLREGGHALLIDGGSGAVGDRLDELGCGEVEWVLHTHHHRDQCWGDPTLIARGARIAVPEYERFLFEDAELFWSTRRIFDNYDDRNTFFASGTDLPVAATLDDYEDFEWRGHRFFVLPAKGHTQGSVAVVAEIDGRTMAFTGDLIGEGGILYQLHAMEYSYGDMTGALFTLQSIQALRDCLTGEEVAGRTFEPARDPLLLPSHDEVIDDAFGDLDRLESRLMDLVDLGRGMAVGGHDSVPEATYLPEAKFVRLSEYLLWGGSWTCSFFYVILSGTGKAMLIDYGHSFVPHMHLVLDDSGLESRRFIEHHLKELRRDWAVTEVDLVVPTHIHDDHVCGIPHLQRHYGTRCVALAEVAQVLADPEAWASTPCTFFKPIRIDRELRDGDRFDWEQFTFGVRHAPGQTEFHSVLSADIDGQRVAFTGDNYFLDEVLRGQDVTTDPFQTTVLRNSFQLAMHRQCVEVMRSIAPELICPGHREVYACDAAALQTYADFIARKEQVFRSLVAEPADQFIDLFWARLLPYMAEVEPGAELTYTLKLRNNLERQATFAVRLLPSRATDGPEAVAEDGFASISLDAGARGEVLLRTSVSPEATPGRSLITAEVEIDGVSQGPVVEALVTVTR